MGEAKQIEVRPIASRDAGRICRALHYSHKNVQNSQVHLGVFLHGKCGGILQFGPSMDKSKTIGLVRGTGWDQFMELNRMALADWLPRNGESRAIGVALRLLRKTYPRLKWILSYADATQCGDGLIYRAAGFVLTGIRKNATLYRMPDGEIVANLIFSAGLKAGAGSTQRRYGKQGTESSYQFLKRIGAVPLPGHQLRYIYFLDPAWRSRLTVPEIPYAEIWRRGVGMYKGERIERAKHSGDAPASQAERGRFDPDPRAPESEEA